MRETRSFTRRAALGVAGSAFAIRAAPAQDSTAAYPDRSVRVIVPYGPGGTNDIVGRIVAAKMGASLGQPFVIENRPGAQAIVGTEAVARSRPDGYTLLIGASGPIVFNPATSDRLSYDPLTDLAPVTSLASFPLVLLVSAEGPHRTAAELIAFAKANPDRANYGSPATSFSLAAELINQRAGTRFQNVAYRGTTDSITALIRGEVTMVLADTAPAAVSLQGGRVRALAITSPARLASFPDVPTMAEVGLTGIEAVFWTGLLAPARTPPAIIQTLNEHANAAIRSPDVRERLANLALEPVGGTPEAFRATIAREIEGWRAVARAANIRLEQ